MIIPQLYINKIYFNYLLNIITRLSSKTIFFLFKQKTDFFEK